MVDNVRIEDYWTIDDGDDYLPAITRFQDEILNKDLSLGWKRFDTAFQQMVIGSTKKVYEFSGPVDLFAIDLVGANNKVEMRFSNLTSGLIVHAPTILAHNVEVPGTHPSGYGGVSRFRDLNIVGSGGAGTIGVQSYMPLTADNVRVSKFGSHGWSINANAEANPRSNANRWRLVQCWGTNNGKTYVPGQIHGCGLFIDGPDTNVGVTDQCYFGTNAGWGIWDSCFLGCTHYSPSVSANGHMLSQDELQLWEASHPGAVDRDANGVALGVYGVPWGGDLELGFSSDSSNARTAFYNRYIEGSAIYDVKPPSVVRDGIGGKRWSPTPLDSVEGMGGIWIHRNAAGDELEFGRDSHIAKFGSILDHASRRYGLHFKPNNPTAVLPFETFYSLDYGALTAQTAALLTGDASRAPDGRILDKGKLVILDHYEGRDDMVPVYYGVTTTPPASLVPANLPIGSKYHCTRPAAGFPPSYIVASLVGIKSWRPYSLTI